MQELFAFNVVFTLLQCVTMILGIACMVKYLRKK